MDSACKLDPDFSPLLPFIYLADAAFKPLKGTFDNHNALIFVKPDKGRADFWTQPHKVPDNLQVVSGKGCDVRVAVQKMVEIRHRFQLLKGFRDYL